MMGQHKYNPTAIAAKNGELPPKPKKKSKRQRKRELMRMICERTGLASIQRRVGLDPYVEADNMADLL